MSTVTANKSYASLTMCWYSAARSSNSSRSFRPRSFYPARQVLSFVALSALRLHSPIIVRTLCPSEKECLNVTPATRDIRFVSLAATLLSLFRSSCSHLTEEASRIPNVVSRRVTRIMSSFAFRFYREMNGNPYDTSSIVYGLV